MRDDNKHIYDLCKQHMHAYVLVEAKDGTKVDGIITGLDDEYVYMAVPIDQPTQSGHASHGPQNEHGHDGHLRYGYPGFGGYPGYGYGGYPVPRFRRLVLPLIGLTALSLLPWY